VLLVPETAAVYCTVLGVVAVLTGTAAGDAGVEVTVTAIFEPPPPPPPLPGACAMQPASGNAAANAKNEKIRPNLF
jgi:hypothetical protein